MAFKDVDKQVNFSKLEEEVLKTWKKNRYFEKSLEKTRNNEQYVFYDGPPFATGLPHYGHILPGTIKDIVPRYQTMKGKYVERRWGWDCHGLPVENLIEKDLNLNSKKEILEYGIDKFNEACRASVLRYTNEWEKTIDRMGRWVDFKNSYRTMDLDYMESIWNVFKSLWEKGLIYEGHKILPYCPRCATPLSNFETNQGYKDVQDPAITVAFKIKGEENCYILAWTTTPWTLPSNMGLAVGEDITYVKIEDEGQNYILAEALLSKYYKNLDSVNILKKYTGKELVGMRYEPLFPYFKDEEKNGAFRITLGHHVSTESGTGIVHIAPGFGEDDAEIGKKEGLPTKCPIDDEAKFTEEIYDYKGIGVKKADKEIMKRLKDEKKLIKHETYQHSYPHCWRCDEPLIYKAVSSWFVDIQAIKQDMIDANSKINWVPAHIKDGRFGKWIEQARDWAISRNRYWGCPIPVWKCEECGETLCVGSVEELEKLSGAKINDIHIHFVDPIKLKCKKCGSSMSRIEEVLDCWFESGAMPYAQNHYPFENKEKFESTYPADFIAEGLDQTRGWFYTLVVLGAGLFKKNAFKNVVVNGLVLAEDGRKMSKRLKNYPEVDYIFDKYGADALRLYLMNSAAVKAGELLFSENGVSEVVRNFHLPLWNSYSFFVTYANIDKWTPKNKTDNFQNPLDIWLNSSVEKLSSEVDAALSEYDFQKAIKFLYKFIDGLTNWYIRRSRRRFWKSEDDSDKNEAYSALYNALMKFTILSAPIAPFLSDYIYSNLKSEEAPESVHLCDYPEENPAIRDKELEAEMDIVQIAVEMGRSLRSKIGINLRKPLNSLYCITKNENDIRLLSKMESILKEELNVKNVVFEQEEEKLVTLTCKANFRVLGKKAGKDMKTLADIISKFGAKEARDLEDGKDVKVKVGEVEYSLAIEDVLVERKEKEGLTILNEGSLTVALDSTLTKELVEEGIAREFIRHIQNLRKDKNLHVADRIKITYNAPEHICAAITSWDKTVKDETLALDISIDGAAKFDANVDEVDIKIDLEKVS
ncbi:MAG TPA: isoleucine--tRNA ligase [Spirochaetota bacterium]|nr:isoleucine--tRNA ligase [Spirochaetota bacterium]HOS55956.1 isoleucine--tRNA ligase [Spirochaetota bacterium]HPK62272.1 isoleucine--tRNA ligase [Spirochaetota bacterium]HQF77934.1 isoleucine--tRNA ligase [Spirochaetota bacterium]HQH31404.1 isoleucine--tRNA ligase [Spirochaetota bacterium]